MLVSAPASGAPASEPPRLPLQLVGASQAARARITGSITQTRFEESQAESVKVVYRFSKRSHRFGYRLAVKDDGAWQRVHSLHKKGHFKGKHTARVTTFFAGQPVGVGHYRLRLASDAGSAVLRFSVIASVPRPVGVKPQAGRWEATSLTGSTSGGGAMVTSLGFTVATDQTTVSSLGFGYTFTFGGCFTTGYSSMAASSPFVSPSFSLGYGATGPWTGAASGSIDGTFDSPTSAHGTGTMQASCSAPASGQVIGRTGTFSWTATVK